MGLGKTIQAIAAIRILTARAESAASLVVAPSGLVLQWRREFRQWAPDLALSTVIGSASDRLRAWRAQAHVFIVGYESLRADVWLKGPSAPGGASGTWWSSTRRSASKPLDPSSPRP
jgi:SNF2 family DNA or RNA helicase